MTECPKHPLLTENLFGSMSLTISLQRDIRKEKQLQREPLGKKSSVTLKISEDFREIERGHRSKVQAGAHIYTFNGPGPA